MFLNVSIVLPSLMSADSVFQRLDAAQLKHLLPYDIVRIFGTTNSCVFWDLGVLTGVYTCNVSQEIGRAMIYTCGVKAYTELGILLAVNGVSLTRA